MARITKADEARLKRQASALKASRKFREDEGYDDLWKRMIDLYRGRHYASTKKEDRMLVNHAFATKNVIAPSVAINNPKFVVNARKAEGADTATITEQVLNYLWRTHKYQDEFRLAVDDFLVVGHGWLKCGYKATKPIELKTVTDADDPENEDAEGVDDRDPSVEGNVESEIKSFSDDDRPFVERISPFDIYCDPDARHPKELKWIAQRTRRPVADVKVDSRYDATARSKVHASIGMARQDDDKVRTIDGTPTDPTITYVDVIEYYDIRKNLVSTFCEQMLENYLIAPTEMPYAFGQPFVMMRNYEVTDLFYPMGELEAIEGLQHELNATRTQMMNHRKRYQRKVLYDKEAFEADGIAALRDDSDNVLVPVDTQAAQVDISKVVAPMPQMGTPPDFYNQSELISNDIDRVSGVSDYMRGAQAEIRRTATEAAMIQDAQNARAADKLSRIESTLSKLGERVVQLMQQYMTGERVVRIVGMSAAPVWIQFDADYIQGEFDFEVEGGSTQPRNESYRRQSAMQLVEAMIPFVQMGVINPQALVRRVLQFGFDMKNPDDLLGMPQQGPAEEGMEGAPTEQGMQPPMGGGMPPMPQMSPSPEGDAESPIEGIPPELIAQLMGQSGLSSR